MNEEQGRLGQKRYGGIFYEEFLRERNIKAPPNSVKLEDAF